MALRTIAGLIPSGTITNAMLAGSIAASKLNLADTFNFTGNVQKNGSAIVAGEQSLYYATVDSVTTANVADLAAGAPSSVNGVNLSQNMDVLVQAQSSQSSNGIYNVDTVGSGANGAWTRAGERDAANELPVGMLVFVRGGAFAGRLFKLKTFAGNLGTDPIIFDEHLEGFTVTNNGEPEVAGTGDGSNLNFDLSGNNVVFVSVAVDGLMQDPGTYSVAAGAGAGGVDQLQFGSGNAPANGAKVECTVFRRI